MTRCMLTLLWILLMMGYCIGQAPDSINYQSIVRDVTGAVVANQAVGVQVKILQGSISGTEVYSETHTPMTNAYGLVTFQIGGGTAMGISDFTSIDWSMGPYYVQIGTDPTGGTDYSQIQGTSQLVSVPYALYANASDSSRTSMMADTVKNEADGDPTNEKISMMGISGDSLSITEGGMTMKVSVDSSNVNEKISMMEMVGDSLSIIEGGMTLKVSVDSSNVNEKISMMEMVGDSLSITEGGMTLKVSVDSSNVNELELPQSPSAGDMNYWDGSDWVSVSAGSQGSSLYFIDGRPVWVGNNGKINGTTDVYNSVTGKVWMDRNLGASQVADSLTDYNSYGDLYQWGRGSDGHHTIVWTSSTTSDGSEQSRETTTLSMMDSVGHDDFITRTSGLFDWRSPQNDNLWQGAGGINNPCPTGYRLPSEAEWQAEIDSWMSNNAAGAFASPLKLPLAGGRSVSSGSLLDVGTYGRYWSSTVSGFSARRLEFLSSSAGMFTSNRGSGRSVRCLKD